MTVEGKVRWGAVHVCRVGSCLLRQWCPCWDDVAIMVVVSLFGFTSMRVMTSDVEVLVGKQCVTPTRRYLVSEVAAYKDWLT